MRCVLIAEGCSSQIAAKKLFSHFFAATAAKMKGATPSALGAATAKCKVCGGGNLDNARAKTHKICVDCQKAPCLRTADGDVRFCSHHCKFEPIERFASPAHYCEEAKVATKRTSIAARKRPRTASAYPSTCVGPIGALPGPTQQPNGDGAAAAGTAKWDRHIALEKRKSTGACVPMFFTSKKRSRFFLGVDVLHLTCFDY
jgi:hypothetical protein